jgi:oligoribonuclease
MLVWCDVETTGLDPDKDALLEVAFVVTDNDMHELDSSSWVLPFDGDTSGFHEIVQKMHTKNGLWEECSRASRAYVPEWRRLVVEQMLRFLRKYTQKGEEICGSTVSFDKRFLEKHLPEVAAHFNHRHVDVSSFLALAKRRRPEALAGLARNEAHRALADIRESIAALRHLSDNGCAA